MGILGLKKVTSQLSKIGGTKVNSGKSKIKGGGVRPLLDNVQNKDAFFLRCLPLPTYLLTPDIPPES